MNPLTISTTHPVPLRTTPMRPRVAVIVPARNEAATLDAVLHEVVNARLVDEVIVVDDRSVDATPHVAARYCRVVQKVTCGGKGDAMRLGVSNVDADIIVFVDADLFGFRHEHLDQLIGGVLGGATMVIGTRQRPWNTWPLINRLSLKVGGERAMRREVWESLQPRFQQGFRIEVALNAAVKELGGTVAVVRMPGVTQRIKERKNLWKGLASRLVMAVEVSAAIIDVALHGATQQRAA
jgi:glycosyltransferase involved in cell wall biosynthesis